MDRSSSLSEKRARFTEGEVPAADPDESAVWASSWDEAEKEHRRKSRAFAKAAAAAAAAEGTLASPDISTVASVDGSSSLPETRPDNKNNSPPPTLPETRPRRPASPGRILRRTASSPLPTGTGRKRKRAGSYREPARSSPGPEAGPGPGRRRRGHHGKPGDDVTLTPLAQRVFDGLAFYYIPDADLGPRKLRIAKARQFGAQWVRRPNEATHVIVDKKLCWGDIRAVVAGEGRGEGSKSNEGSEATAATAITVNEDYPLDCISFGCLLNPDQRRYRIPGCPLAAPELPPGRAAAREESAESRPAKPQRPVERPCFLKQEKEVPEKRRTASPKELPLKEDPRQRRRSGTPPRIIDLTDDD